MTILEKKVDAIARSLLAVNPASRDTALKDLEQLMTGDVPAGTVQEEIDNILTQLGIPSRIVGYRYLSAAIKLCVKDKSLSRNITKRLYPEAGIACGATKSKVERGIRHAIELCFERCDPDVIEHYFGNTVSPNKGKLTNSEFIVQLSNIIRTRTNTN